MPTSDYYRESSSKSNDRDRYPSSVDMGPEYENPMPISTAYLIGMGLPGWKARLENWETDNRKLRY